MKSIKKLIMAVILIAVTGFSLQAGIPERIKNSARDFYYAITSHYWMSTDILRAIYKQEKISDVNELFIQEIIKELKIPYTIKICRINKANCAAIGGGFNILLIGEDFLNSMTNAEKRFVIGHELMHLEKMHTLKCVALAMGIATLLQHATDESFATASKRVSQTLSLHKPLYRRIISEILHLSLIPPLLCLMSPFARRCELEADAEAVRRLGPEALRGGFSIFSRWAQYESQDTFLTKLLATHPSSKERLEQLLELSKEILIP